MSYDTYHSGPLYALRAKKDTFHRKVNGNLINPPRLFVTYYSDMHGCVESAETDWDAAYALAPKNVAEIYAAMRADRDQEYVEERKDRRQQEEWSRWYT